MARYVVLDTSWLDDHAASFGAYTGRELDSFHTFDCAKALALQRMAAGDLGVIVVDRLANDRVFPASTGEAHDTEDPPGSGTRANSAAADTTARSRVKSSA
jgi:hypothetical protein